MSFCNGSFPYVIRVHGKLSICHFVMEVFLYVINVHGRISVYH